MWRLDICLLVLCLVLAWRSTAADIYTLPPLTLQTGHPVIQRVAALYASGVVPTVIADRNGEDSYISLDMQFTATDYPPSADSKVEVSILQATTLYDLGYVDPITYQISYCCTSELLNSASTTIPGCTSNTLNQLIIQPTAKYQQSFFATFDGVSNTAALTPSTSTYAVQNTGEHVMITSNCDYSMQSDIQVTGVTTWHNTYGYLPGRLYNYLPFYLSVLTYYCLITAVWLFLLIKHRADTVTVQYFITFVLIWSCMEFGIDWLDYSEFNKNGVRNLGVVYAAIVLTACRLTVSRLLVVCVSLGYGSVRAELGKSNLIKLALSGIAYLACEGALDYVTREAIVNKSNDQSAADQLRALVTIPLLLLNVLFYYWIFTALNGTIQLLKDNAQHAKLRVYQWFLGVLVFSLIGSFGFSFWQTWFLATGQLALHFSLVFLIDDGFFTIIYTVIISGIALLWKPSRDSKSYGYAEIGMNDTLDDFDKLELAEGPASNTHNTTTPRNGNGAPPRHFTIDDDDA